LTAETENLRTKKGFLQFISSSLIFWLLLTAAVALVPTIHFGYSPDSAHLIDIARNLSNGEGLSTYYLSVGDTTIPSKEVMWPPLYPLILMIFMKLGFSVGLACRLVNVISFVVISWFLFCTGRGYKPQLLSILSVGFWLIMVMNLLVANYAWSEPLFMAIVSIGLLCLYRIIRNEKYSMAQFLILGIIAGFAALCRYIGITMLFPPVFLVFILLKKKKLGIGKSVKNCLAVAVGFSLVFLPYLAYNLVQTKDFLPVNHAQAELSIIYNSFHLAKSILEDFIPILIVIGVLLFIFYDRSWRVFRTDIKKSFDIYIITICSWVMAYFLSMLFLTSYLSIDEMNTRFTSPAYPAMIFVVGHLIVRLINGKLSDQHKSSIGIAFLIFAVILSALHVSKIEIQDLQRHKAHKKDDGYIHLSEWIESSTSQRDLFIGEPIWEVRFRADRVVLESVYPDQPKLTPSAIEDFLRRLGSRFDSFYYIAEKNRAPDFSGDLGEEFSEHNMYLRHIIDFDYCNRPVVVYKLEYIPKH